MRDDFVMAVCQPSREGEATRVDVGGDNGGKFERRLGGVGSRVGRSSLWAKVLFGEELHGGKD